MKLTKKLEAEILKRYHAYWDAYLSGDMKTFASYLDTNISVYGTAIGEVFKTKSEAIKFYKATAQQMTGKADFRKRKIKIKAVGDTIVINEQCDLYVLVEEAWTFYGHVRVTAVFEQKENTWKIVHQHASFPDSRAEAGEQIAAEKIKEENLQLREAVKRRTVELEHKNRELEIETALEKVRAIAMSMIKPDNMLNVCQTISLQLEALGLKHIRNVQTAIFYESRGTYMNYEYYAKHTKTFITEVDYKNHKLQLAFAKKMMKGANEEVLEHLKGKKLQDWYTYQKSTNQFADKYLLKAQSLNYYWYSLGPVALGISTYYPLTKEDTVLFKRFLKVFELAYRRYLDIEKATAQAKEAQIEAALERIRARALAMHQSAEFTEVAKVMREQMGLLGQPELETSAVHLYNEDADTIFSWRAFRLSSKLKGNISYGFFKIPKTSCAIAREFVQKFNSKATDYTIEVSGAKQTAWYKVLFILAPEVADAMKKSGTTKEKRYYHFSKFTGGALLMVSSKEPASDAVELQKRSAQVFDLAYRRFKDLQKAEAQAREAQIELSLERVRTGAMAMRQSAELGQLIFVLYQELTKLDAQLDRCFIMIVDPETQGITWWLAGKEGLLAENGFFIPMNQHPTHLMYLDCWRERKKKWQYLFEGKEKRDWDRFGFSKTELAKLPDYIQRDMAGMKKIHLSGSSDAFGSLVTGSLEPLAEEHQDIISRFTIAFNQAYTRFLDLQKAEAQTREAQIEVALERVRARTMAMHKSEDLSETSVVLFNELKKLGIQTTRSGFGIYDEANQAIQLWLTTVLGQLSEQNVLGTIPLQAHNAIRENYRAWKEKKSMMIHTFSGKEVKEYYQKIGNYLSIASQKKYPERLVFSVFFFSEGSLNVMTEYPLTEDDNKIMLRFSNVFGLTYRRFLDLQNAEAQTRESQTQLALERVRARTMAMQQSNELPEAANVLFQQVQSLGMPAWSTGYCIWDDDKQGITLWMSSEGVMQPCFHAPLTKDPSFIHMREAYEKGQAFHVEEVGSKELVKHYKYMRTLPVVGDVLDSIIEAGHPLPVFQIFHCVYFSQGFLLFITYEPVPEAHKIFKRFGKVFDQTYTRFLDLQKAEAQAREAQIEMALERVRSRSLAMHSSGELGEVVTVVLNNLMELGYIIDQGSAAHLVIFSEGTKDFVQWSADPALPHPVRIFIPYTDLPILTEFWNARQKGHDFFAKVYSFDEKNTWFNFAFEHSDLKYIPGELKKLLLESETYAHSIAIEKNSAIIINSITGNQLSKNQIDILRRFSKVFEQAYVRFLDLQKAEAQAKEAQIEAALERVRSRSMAMHKSDELVETVAVMFEQFKALGEEPERMAIEIVNEKENVFEIWATQHGGSQLNLSVKLSLDEPHVMRKMYTAWKLKTKSITIDLQGNELDEYFSYLKKRGLPVQRKIFGKRRVQNVATFSRGILTIITPEPRPQQTIHLLERFASVFDQTYTRFLDLQKAEAQAREAQIEAALERVRSRTMAMHNSRELNETAELLYRELTKLGIEKLTCGFTLLEEKTTTGTCYMANPEGGFTWQPFRLDHSGSPVFHSMYESWKQLEPFQLYELAGQVNVEHNKYLAENADNFPMTAEQLLSILPPITFSNIFNFRYGYLLVVSLASLSKDQCDISSRFARVFEQTYTRFLDLQKAEAQTKEAQIETALEKVRSRTMAMQSSNELQETAAVLFQEFKKLGTEDMLQVTIGIYHEEDRIIDFRVTNWSGGGEQENRSFQVDMDEPALVKPAIAAWKAGKKSAVFDLTGEALQGWLNYRNKISGLHINSNDTDGRRVITAAYFSRGHLTISSLIPLQQETIKTLERFASVFDGTYTRFLDLEKAEAQALQAEQDLIAIKEAKLKAEEALAELQNTQKQLIQAEKMASLGELTAGIAHEIQNPLNFVNNFSEVSKELLDEMREAIEKGDTDDAKEIMNDVIQNLEKINHHGKRADGIVKGMLQHSRSGNGKKEPININALADEYLRLAYHGLRAKDKSFNATMKTDFDETIGNINIIPQDMGRVILNLITNAFYVVNEKSKQGLANYEPTVIVKTSKNPPSGGRGAEVLVSVKDNGNGIPQKILDKIFQPFFTTKPTGQGTGLGLSLSYDIVQSHGGEIKVNTKENEGTEFTISLPA